MNREVRSLKFGSALCAAPVMTFCAILVCAGELAAGGSQFLEQVTGNFSNWDRDGDGALSVNEIELAVNDPDVKSEAAAAVAALRRGVRATKGIQTLSLDQIKASIPYHAQAGTPRYDLLYSWAMKRIGETKRELFVSGTPKLDTLGQGHLGDCYLLAALGAAVARDPQRVVGLFKTNDTGEIEVRFATGAVTIHPPTDGEIAIGASTRNDGTWAMAFEKAVGMVWLSRQKSGKHVSPLSIIGVGGSPHTVAELITGRKMVRVGCELVRNEKDEAKRAEILSEMRAKIVEARKQGKLIVGGTGPLGYAMTVPGIYYNHSYAIVDFDEKEDVVTFWNPIGLKFTPKGPAGLKNGYVTEYGRFKVPLGESVEWFGSYSIETETPVGKLEIRNPKSESNPKPE